MTTRSIHGLPGASLARRSRSWPAWTIRLAAISCVLTSAALSLAVLILSAWAVARGFHDQLATLAWVTGLMFLAVAVDSRARRATWQLLTGLFLLAMAIGCSRMAPELGLFAAGAVTPWINRSWWRRYMRRR